MAVSRIAGALVSLALGALAGVAGYAYWQGQEDKALSISSMIAGFERRNDLIVLSAQVVPVVTSRKEGLVDMLDSEQTAIIPARVDYTVDIAALTERSVSWDNANKTMTITIPRVMIQPPNLDEQRARYYRKGVWVSENAMEGLFRQNSATANQEAIRLARNPNLVKIAEDNAIDVVTGNATQYLRGAGIADAHVTVRFAQ